MAEKLEPRVVTLILGSLFSLAACSPAQSARTAPSDDGSGHDLAASFPSEVSPSGEIAEGESDLSTSNALIDGRKAEPSAALPRLSFKHLGMHIGGESNSATAKRPWLEDIQSGEGNILRCYRLVKDPLRGGSYGIDLYVGSRGGAPEIRSSRQKIGGDDFDHCMRSAFSSLAFHQPERPTVLSYSLLFELDMRH